MGLYNFLLVLQFLSILLLFYTTIYLFSTWTQKSYSNLFLYSMTTLINNIGYFIEMTGKTSGECLLGTKIAYLGKAFIPLALLCFTIQYLGLKLTKRMQCILGAIHTVFFFLVFTCEHHKLFYTGITYTTEGLFPHNVYTHGIFYKFYTGILFFYMFIVFGITIRQHLISKARSAKIRTILVLACAIISMAGFTVFLCGITSGYDTTAPAYMICTIVMIVAVIKYDLLELFEAVSDYISDNLYAGLIAENKNGQLLYFNKPAEKIFSNLQTDYSNTVAVIRKHLSENSVIMKDENIYKPRITELMNRNRKIGTMYILDDITEEYRHAEKIEHMALTDAMTGFENRRAYEAKISELENSGIPDDLIYISFDVNGLKKANDDLGHDAGDELIKSAAWCIRKCYGKYGNTYRTGGDEFIAIINMDEEEFKKVQESFSETVSAWTGFIVKELSISEGVVSKKEFPGMDMMELAKAADRHMYENKKQHYLSTGKDRRSV